MTLRLLLFITLTTIEVHADGAPDPTKNPTKAPTTDPTINVEEVEQALLDEIAALEDGLPDISDLPGVLESITNLATDLLPAVVTDVDFIFDFVLPITSTAPALINDIGSFITKTWHSFGDIADDGVKLQESFEGIKNAVGFDIDIVGDVANGFFQEMIDTGLIAEEWFEYLAEAAAVLPELIGVNRRRLRDIEINYVEYNRERVRRRLSETCSIDDGYDDLCLASAAVYTSGSFYDDVVKAPLELDVSSFLSDLIDINGQILPDDTTYTDGNTLAFYILIHKILDVLIQVGDDICNIAVSCGDPLIGDCIASAICNFVPLIFHVANEAFGYILSNADYHDALTTSTQMQAIFDNRINIVENQKKIHSFTENEFLLTNSLITTEISDFTTDLETRALNTRNIFQTEIDEFTLALNTHFDITDTLFRNEMSALTVTMNSEFDITDQLIDDSFTALHTLLNDKFSNTFDKLMEIDRLTRTQSGKRDDWNKQDKDSIVEPGDLPFDDLSTSTGFASAFDKPLQFDDDINTNDKYDDHHVHDYDGVVVINRYYFYGVILIGFILTFVLLSLMVFQLCTPSNYKYKPVSVNTDIDIE